MNDRGKSDSPVVPTKPPNNAACAVAEVVEERGLAEGNTSSSTRPGLRAGSAVPSGLDRVREVARRDKEARFTALLHHIDLPRLRAAFWAIRPKAAAGVDGVTWQDYRQGLDENLRDLHGRVHSGAYQASHRGERTYRRPTGGGGRSVSLRWRTRLSSGLWSRCSTRSTRRTSWAFPMGFGRDRGQQGPALDR